MCGMIALSSYILPDTKTVITFGKYGRLHDSKTLYRAQEKNIYIGTRQLAICTISVCKYLNIMSIVPKEEHGNSSEK